MESRLDWLGKEGLFRGGRTVEPLLTVESQTVLFKDSGCQGILLHRIYTAIYTVDPQICTGVIGNDIVIEFIDIQLASL